MRNTLFHFCQLWAINSSHCQLNARELKMHFTQSLFPIQISLFTNLILSIKLKFDLLHSYHGLQYNLKTCRLSPKLLHIIKQLLNIVRNISLQRTLWLSANMYSQDVDFFFSTGKSENVSKNLWVETMCYTIKEFLGFLKTHKHLAMLVVQLPVY